MEARRALSGLRILDFSWAAVGPLATKYLADHGATVIKIETATKLDFPRTGPPFAGGTPGVNRSSYFAMYNSSKLSVTINLNKPKGVEIAKRLVNWSDVVVENFMAGTMEAWDLGYADLKTLKKDIIMVRASLQGQTGPHKGAASFGPQLVTLAGFGEICGWPDRPPVSPGGVGYSDFFLPMFVIVAIMTAVDYKRRTGEGTCVDLSQLEASLSFLAPALLDCASTGRVARRDGNRSPYAAPHGAYRCLGDDRWCTIAIFSDVEWDAFCRVLDWPGWATNSKFATLLRRKENEDELDRLIEQWTTGRSAEQVVTLLQEAGVPSGLVENGKDLFNDPQLRHREHFKFVNHPEMGIVSHAAAGFRLSKTPSNIRPAPCLGEHNYSVLTEIAGLSDDEFAELVDSGVVY